VIESSTDPSDGQLHHRLDQTLYRELARAQHEVLLLSPLITTQVTTTLRQIVRSSPAAWTVLTRLDPQAIAGRYLSTSGLLDLMNEGVEIRHAPRLHAKLYLADGFFGTIGSANLTGTGLGTGAVSNLELSVRLDGGALAEAWRQGRAWTAESTVLTEADIRLAEMAARRLPRSAPPGRSSDSARHPARSVAVGEGAVRRPRLGAVAPSVLVLQPWRPAAGLSARRPRAYLRPGDAHLLRDRRGH
jgi:hypothetical protein